MYEVILVALELEFFGDFVGRPFCHVQSSLFLSSFWNPNMFLEFTSLRS